MSDKTTSRAERFMRWLVWLRWPLLLIGIALTAAAWLPSRNLQFDRSIENMFAPSDPLLVPFRKLKRTFGGDELVMAAYVDPELLSAEGIERLATVTEALSKVEGVEAAISLANVPLLGTPGRRNRQMLELFEGYLVGADRQTTAVVCLLTPRAEARARSATIHKLRSIISAHDATGVIAGEPVMVVDGFEYVEQDGRRLQGTSTLLLTLVILFCFRSLRWVLAPLAIVQATMIWTEGVLVLGQFRLSMVSSMLAAIVTVVGIATVVHVVVRFREERRLGSSPRDSLILAGAALLTPIFWSCLTDAAGFGSLLASQVGPVKDFGTMMAIGSLLVLVAVVLLLPGLALLGPVASDPKRAWGEQGLDVGLERLVNALLRRPGVYALVSFAIAGVAAAGSYWLDVETDFTRNFRQTSPIVRSYEFVESRLGGAGVWDIILPAPDELNEPYLDRVRQLQQRLRSEVGVTGLTGEPEPGLTKVLSLVDAIDASPGLDLVPSFMRGNALPIMLRTIERQMPAIATALRGEDPEQPGQQYYRIMLRARERQPSQQKKELIADVERISREEFPEAEVTGFFVLLTNIIDSMLRDQWLTFGIATGAIWLMMLLVFRSLTQSLLALVPNVMPILVVTGLMGWLGLRINMGAAMIASVSIGLSVDSSIHYLVAYNRQRTVGRSLKEALHAVHQSVGRAMIFSTLALIVGFTALVQSQFVPTIYFGVLVSLAMLGGLAGNLIVLPLLLALVDRGGSTPEPPSPEAAAPAPEERSFL